MFGYDANGNEISKTDATNSWTYTWDDENRLKQASLSGGMTVHCRYDALGRRVERASTSTEPRNTFTTVQMLGCPCDQVETEKALRISTSLASRD